MTGNPPNDPDRGYRAGEHALDSPSPAEIAAETQPDAQDRAENSFGDRDGQTRSLWNPEDFLDLTPDRGPGLAAGIGLQAGADGVISFEELRRRAKKRRDSSYAEGVEDQYERAREQAKEGADLEDIDPVDGT
jgi:hypothetical protein